MGIRITTWNVNGIRNPFGYEPWRERRTFEAMFETLDADIVVMQETKIQRKDLTDDMVLVPGWDVFFSLPKYKKGYSGVAIYTRTSKCCPIRAEEGITGILCPPGSSTSFRDLPPDQQIGGYPKLDGGIDDATLDSEGRCVILEFPALVLIGVYSPAARDDSRTDFRLAFLRALDARVRNLVAAGKQVVLAGDLNIIRAEIDAAGARDMTADVSTPRRLLNQLLFGGERDQLLFEGGERDQLLFEGGERDQLLFEGERREPVLWDLCRLFHPDRRGMYTCWETRKNARPGNFGSRIDYVLCSAGVRDWFCEADVQQGLLGSDHCPVFATLRDQVEDVHVIDRMNPEGMFVRGRRVREWSAKLLLPTSARLLPEFDRRRSIRDMFQAKAVPAEASKKPDEKTPDEKTPDEKTPDEKTPDDEKTEAPRKAVPAEASKKAVPDTEAPNKAPKEVPDENTEAPVKDGKFNLQTVPTSAREASASSSYAKRPAPSQASQRPQKRAAVKGPSRGQSSLMGFFTVKTPVSASETAPRCDTTAGSVSDKTSTLASAFDGKTPPGFESVSKQTVSASKQTESASKQTPEAPPTEPPPRMRSVVTPPRFLPKKLDTPKEPDDSPKKPAYNTRRFLPKKPDDTRFLPKKPDTPKPDTPNPDTPLDDIEEWEPADDIAEWEAAQELVHDPIAAKESWAKLLGGRVPPLCEHGEPCVSLLTKKPGVNCGRSFYICPRPLGPTGDKESGTPFRCKTFIWSSDWNGHTGKNGE